MSFEDVLKLKDYKIIDTKNTLGYVLALVSVFIWGMCTVLGKKLSLDQYPPLQIMGGRFIFGLHQNIAVVQPQELKNYLNEIVAGMGY